jgi:hypothetical protein
MKAAGATRRSTGLFLKEKDKIKNQKSRQMQWHLEVHKNENFLAPILKFVLFRR